MGTKETGITGPQACKVVGISYRQLDYWDRTDLVHPSLSQASGSGSKRIYSYSDLLELKIVKKMLDADFNLQMVRRAIDYLRNDVGELANADLVIDGDRILLANSDAELIDILQNGQGVLQGVYSIIAVRKARTELDAALEMIVPPDQRAVVIDLRDKTPAQEAVQSF